MSENSDEIRLRSKVQQLVRSLGVFRSQTPCGRPISVSGAHALMILSQKEDSGSISQKELQQFLNIDKSNVARLCAYLENNGYITQKRSENDARIKLLLLTAKGKKLSSQLHSDSSKRFSKILSQIPKRFHLQVFDSLDLLLGSLKVEIESKSEE